MSEFGTLKGISAEKMAPVLESVRNISITDVFLPTTLTTPQILGADVLQPSIGQAYPKDNNYVDIHVSELPTSKEVSELSTSKEVSKISTGVDLRALVESSGNDKAVGMMMEWSESKKKLVPMYRTNVDGTRTKIPSGAYGARQVTIPAALSTELGQKLFKGLTKKEMKQKLFIREINIAISDAYLAVLHKQIGNSRWGFNLSDEDRGIYVDMAYNFKGENFVKEVLNKVKPENAADLMKRHMKYTFNDAKGKPRGTPGLPKETLQYVAKLRGQTFGGK
jgi:hypothetical protein